MPAIGWKEPPAPSAKYGSDEEKRQLIQQLRKNPGKWARVKKNMRSQSAKGSWTRFDLEAVAAPAESDPKLFDIYARAPETPAKAAKAKAAGPVPSPSPRAPSVVPAAEAAPARTAEEDAAWAARQEDDRELVVPVPPSEAETTPEAKAATAAWKNRLKPKAGVSRG